MMQENDRQEDGLRTIEVEVQSRHYRPIPGEWLASGIVRVGGKETHWNAARQNDQWKVTPAGIEGWGLEGKALPEAVELIVLALRGSRKFLSRPEAEKEKARLLQEEPRVLLAHGGGTLMRELIREVILKNLSNPVLDALGDSAILPRQTGRIMFTTDTFVVRPLFFAGGDIGRLAVCGTVNNLLVSGARPLAISLSLVIEEGLPLSTLQKIILSVKQAAAEAKVRVVTGDTKVVEKGTTHMLFINTAGLGVAVGRLRVGLGLAKPGDAVLVSGQVGNHGIAVICAREGLKFATHVTSDVAPLTTLVSKLLKNRVAIRAMKDPTRGGLAAALNEIAGRSRVQIEIDQAAIPIAPEIEDSCEMLSLDPLYVASEGVMVAVCSQSAAKKALAAMKGHPLGARAAIIGRVKAGEPGRVVLKTRTGGSHIVDMPYGELLPRIC